MMISPFLSNLCHLDRYDFPHLFVETVYPSSVLWVFVLPRRRVVCSVVLSILFVPSFYMYFLMSGSGLVLVLVSVMVVALLGSVSATKLLYWI